MDRPAKKTIQQLKAEIEQGQHPLQATLLQDRIIAAKAVADALSSLMDPTETPEALNEALEQ